MPDIRPVIRAALLLAAIVLLAVSACVPPIAFHDGLPAWAPEAGGVEARVGYHRLSVFNSDTLDIFGYRFVLPDYGIGYLTPGVRVGLGHPPLAAEVGLTSVILAGGGAFSAMAGPAFGLGYSSPELSAMFRPSMYMFGISGDESGTEVDMGYWTQVSMLVGTGHRARGLNFAAGGRASPFGAGPVAVVGVNLRPVEFRAELSYMFPMTAITPPPPVAGRALTIGITAAAPAKPEPKPDLR